MICLVGVFGSHFDEEMEQIQRGPSPSVFLFQSRYSPVEYVKKNTRFGWLSRSSPVAISAPSPVQACAGWAVGRRIGSRLLVSSKSSVDGVSSLKIFSTVSDTSRLNSNFVMITENTILESMVAPDGQQVRPASTEIHLETCEIRWYDPVAIGSEECGLGVIGASLKTTFANLARRFTIIGGRKLHMGESEDDHSVVYYPVTPVGLETGQWITEGGIILMVDPRNLISTNVRINTLMSGEISMSAYLLELIMLQIGSIATIGVEVHDHDEGLSYSVRNWKDEPLPDITFLLFGYIMHKLPVDKYCDANTGKITIPTNNLPGLVLDIGLAVIQDTTVHFDVTPPQVGFSLSTSAAK